VVCVAARARDPGRGGRYRGGHRAHPGPSSDHRCLPKLACRCGYVHNLSPIPDDGFQERFDAWLEREQDQRVTWLGLVDGDPAGMVNLLVFTRMPRPGQDLSQWGYLANCYVRPEHRNSGLGARMLAACTSYADEQGFVRIVLRASERSAPFYVRGGFEPATSLMVRRPGPRA